MSSHTEDSRRAASSLVPDSLTALSAVESTRTCATTSLLCRRGQLQLVSFADAASFNRLRKDLLSDATCNATTIVLVGLVVTQYLGPHSVSRQLHMSFKFEHQMCSDSSAQLLLRCCPAPRPRYLQVVEDTFWSRCVRTTVLDDGRGRDFFLLSFIPPPQVGRAPRYNSKPSLQSR